MGRGKHQSYSTDNGDKLAEFRRRIKELTEQNGRLEDEIVKLRRQLAKSTPIVEEIGSRRQKKKPDKPVSKPCPDCGMEIRITELPHAVMELCSAGCGFRLVRNKK
jgi:hypothetical protein